MKVIVENSTAEIVEKKSRFIANVFYAENENDANEKLNDVKKKYYDAKHNCYAYIIGENGEIVKSSDDGEPQGTAGHPMLDILKGSDFTNCIAVVTRYFGGILLGTGGLVRAYSDSLKLALSNAKTSYLNYGYIIDFIVGYDEYGKIENMISSINLRYVNECQNEKISNNLSYDMPIRSINKNFENNIKLEYLVKESAFEELKKQITNITKGKILLEKNEKRIYYISDNKVVYI